MSNALVTIKNMLDTKAPEFERALPKATDQDRFSRVAMTMFQRVPKLQQCTSVSLYSALLEVAQLGLYPDFGQAWLIPYGKEAKFQIGYKGLMELARRSGEIKKIEAREVRVGDAFTYHYGLNPTLEHVPCDAPGELTYAYAIAWLTNGETQFEVLDRKYIDSIQKRSKSGSSGPWVTDFSAMAKKTAIIRLAKYLPASSEFHQAAHVAEYEEFGDVRQATVIEEPKPDSSNGRASYRSKPEENTKEVSEPDAGQSEPEGVDPPQHEPEGESPAVEPEASPPPEKPKKKKGGPPIDQNEVKEKWTKLCVNIQAIAAQREVAEDEVWEVVTSSGGFSFPSSTKAFDRIERDIEKPSLGTKRLFKWLEDSEAELSA